jgi:hypothetical protein
MTRPTAPRANAPREADIEAARRLAWPAFVEWAFLDAKVRQDFTAANGIMPAPDAAMSELAKFIEWATVEVYGIKNAPKAVRDAITAGTFVAESLRRTAAWSSR